MKIKCSVSPNKNNLNQLTNLMHLWIDIDLEERIKVNDLMHKLFETNKKLWKLEDTVRSDIDEKTFLNCAKDIFSLNFIRNTIKKDIDKIMKSEFYDEKIYN